MTVDWTTLPRSVPSSVKVIVPFKNRLKQFIVSSCQFLFFLIMVTGITYGIYVSVERITQSNLPLVDTDIPNDTSHRTNDSTLTPTPSPNNGKDVGSTLPTDTNKNIVDKTIIPLLWFDIKCGDSSPPPTPPESIQKAIDYTNDIFTRSKSNLRMTLAGIKNVTAPSSCFILGHDVNTINKLVQNVNMMISESDTINYRHAVRVVRVVTGQEAVSGFTIVGSGTSFIRTNEYSRVFTHEIGHAMGLTHAFPSTTGVLDIPPSCTTNEAARVALLAKCPVGVRTCRGSIIDEDISNVMDYLPESCGKPYTLAVGQIGVLHQWIYSKY